MTDKIDFGTAYLARVLAHAVAAAHKVGNEGKVSITDEGETTLYPSTPEGILEAAQYAKEVDGLLNYRVHLASFVVLYDGPYDHGNAAEVINDGNARSELYTKLADVDFGL